MTVTAAERADLNELRGEMREGFKEVRDNFNSVSALLEARRLADEATERARRLEDAVADKALVEKLGTVETQMAITKALSEANRRYMNAAAVVATVAGAYLAIFH